MSRLGLRNVLRPFVFCQTSPIIRACKDIYTVYYILWYPLLKHIETLSQTDTHPTSINKYGNFRDTFKALEGEPSPKKYIHTVILYIYIININIYFFFVRLFSAVEGRRWSHASQVLMSTDRGLEHGLRSFWVRVISSPWIRVRRWHRLHSKLLPVRSISCVGCPNHLLASRGPW